jgi:hypothetical protein
VGVANECEGLRTSSTGSKIRWADAREGKSLLTSTQIPLLSQNTNDSLPFTQSRTSFPRSINPDALEEMMVFVYGNLFRALEVEPQDERSSGQKEQGAGLDLPMDT